MNEWWIYVYLTTNGWKCFHEIKIVISTLILCVLLCVCLCYRGTSLPSICMHYYKWLWFWNMLSVLPRHNSEYCTKWPYICPRNANCVIARVWWTMYTHICTQKYGHLLRCVCTPAEHLLTLQCCPHCTIQTFISSQSVILDAPYDCECIYGYIRFKAHLSWMVAWM